MPCLFQQRVFLMKDWMRRWQHRLQGPTKSALGFYILELFGERAAQCFYAFGRYALRLMTMQSHCKRACPKYFDPGPRTVGTRSCLVAWLMPHLKRFKAVSRRLLRPPAESMPKFFAKGLVSGSCSVRAFFSSATTLERLLQWQHYGALHIQEDIIQPNIDICHFLTLDYLFQRWPVQASPMWAPTGIPARDLLQGKSAWTGTIPHSGSAVPCRCPTGDRAAWSCPCR